MSVDVLAIIKVFKRKLPLNDKDSKQAFRSSLVCLAKLWLTCLSYVVLKLLILQGFIQRVQHDYLSLYECTELLHELLKPIAARCIVLFVRHASLLYDISEAGKLKLTGDMAQVLNLNILPVQNCYVYFEI